MNRTRKALLKHGRVNVLDCLAEPRKLQPNPLLIVIILHFLAGFVVRLFEVFFVSFEHKGVLKLLYVNSKLLLSLLFHALLIIVAFI